MKKSSRKKRRIDCLKIICWIIVPMAVVVLIILDALNIYTFNTERLLVLGIGLLVVLLPFFSEITIKNLSVKRNNSNSSGKS